ncbi:MAG: AAA family ATPase [Deltaproteobacteria bacterium]|jgi:putative secretion ATPase (PEP-CTERM system associated)|nr:AAA family ATPase [Deltaproteobacteria bacterium]
MYNKFFGFKEKPFKLVPNPEYLFLSKSHEEALAHLTYAISHGEGFVEITGEVGTGKTTLCRVFLENLDKNIDAAYIFNPKLDALQLLKATNDEFGIDSEPDNTKDLIDTLNGFLIEKKAAGQKVLVLIDEAQNLSLEVLEQLRLLSNLETTQEKLLQIILVGQPELGEMLSSQQLRQLGQRITINSHLDPLTFQETKDYIRHRISLASHRAGPPFDKTSYRVIYEYSKGIPRLINIACDRALLNAFGRNSFKITGALAKEAIKELTREKPGSSPGLLQGVSGLAVAAAVIATLAVLMFFLSKENLLKTEALTTAQLQKEQTVHAEEPAAKEASLIGKTDIIPDEGQKVQQNVSIPAADTNAMALKEPISEQETEELLAEKYTDSTLEKITEESVSYSVHASSFQSEALAGNLVEELQALGYQSFMYAQENSSGDAAFVVVADIYQSFNLAKEASMDLINSGYNNFIVSVKDHPAVGMTAAEQQTVPNLEAGQPRADEEDLFFFEYLKSLNARYSRNTSIDDILNLWFPTGRDPLLKKRMTKDPFFFQEAATQFGLQVQPVATESDLTLIQSLNLPTIFTFYLPGHNWPKYIAVSSINEDTVYFTEGLHNSLVSVGRDIFLKYWSGEAYVFWKNFNKLNGVISHYSTEKKIRRLKKLLQQIGYSGVDMSDTYDNNTRQIIKDIQKKYGLNVDGTVGSFTKMALYNESSEFIKPTLASFKAERKENGI